MSFLLMPNPIVARRLFLGQSGLVLSGAAVALLAGKHALAAGAGEAGTADAQILNTALGAELEAIAAYQSDFWRASTGACCASRRFARRD